MKKEKWLIVFYLIVSLICLGFYFLLSGLVMLILAGIALFWGFCSVFTLPNRQTGVCEEKLEVEQSTYDNLSFRRPRFISGVFL
ncbi:hypothetical protein [Listeria fleischmannii]|uniref:hypothetical protein n=1 Tax=Listeria fleischmannii TaxID=1069827 RepID=UPI000FE143F8|nr:hypothetical protein [Listeria fleischmannii]